MTFDDSSDLLTKIQNQLLYKGFYYNPECNMLTFNAKWLMDKMRQIEPSLKSRPLEVTAKTIDNMFRYTLDAKNKDHQMLLAFLMFTYKDNTIIDLIDHKQASVRAIYMTHSPEGKREPMVG